MKLVNNEIAKSEIQTPLPKPMFADSVDDIASSINETNLVSKLS